MSRIGIKSISLPEKVALKVDGSSVEVEGPKGKLQWDLPSDLSISQEDGVVEVKRSSEQRQLRAMHGTARSLINNMVTGVSEGFTKELEIQGVGFRAAVKGKALGLSLGKSHPIEHPIPEGLKEKEFAT